MEILLSLNMKEQSLEDQYLVRKAKFRFVYWQGHDKVYKKLTDFNK